MKLETVHAPSFSGFHTQIAAQRLSKAAPVRTRTLAWLPVWFNVRLVTTILSMLLISVLCSPCGGVNSVDNNYLL